MIKLLLTGAWVCIVTLGAVYASVWVNTPRPPVDADAARKANQELVRGEQITVPVIADSGISGYFLTRVSFMMDKEKIRDVKLPLMEATTDGLFSLLVGKKMINLEKPGAFDLQTFKAEIKAGLNSKLGDEYVQEVIIEQIDYMSKEDIRNNASRGNKNPNPGRKIVEGVKVEDPKKPSGS